MMSRPLGAAAFALGILSIGTAAFAQTAPLQLPPPPPPTALMTRISGINMGAQTGVPLIYLYNGNAANRYGFGINAGELQTFFPNTSHVSWNGSSDLQASGTNELMRLTGAGSLGIGTTNPFSQLDVVGNATITSSSPGSNGDINMNSGYRPSIYPNGPNVPLVGGVPTLALQIRSAGAGELHLNNDDGGNILMANSVATGGNSNVGIGTFTPGAKLDVAGTMNESDIAHFVTNGGYMTLGSMNGGLPAIPSAGTRLRLGYTSDYSGAPSWDYGIDNSTGNAFVESAYDQYHIYLDIDNNVPTSSEEFGIFHQNNHANNYPGSPSATEVFKVDGAGNINANGVITADGSGLTNVNATKLNGNTVPGNSSGVLANNGSGNLSWTATPTFSSLTVTGQSILGSGSAAINNVRRFGVAASAFTVPANGSVDLGTAPLPGFGISDGDPVFIGIPSSVMQATPGASFVYSAWIGAGGAVFVRFHNDSGTAVSVPAATWIVSVIK